MAVDVRGTEAPPAPRPQAWTRLIGGLGIAFDPRKLILAALGLVMMFAGWTGLDALFSTRDRRLTEPTATLHPRQTVVLPPSPFSGRLDYAPHLRENFQDVPEWEVLARADQPIGWAAFPQAARMTADPVRIMTAPFVGVFRRGQGALSFLHALLAACWTALVWGVVGGAIARVAVVQLATGEPLGVSSALRFGLRKAGSLAGAPLCPLIAIAVFGALCGVFGLLYRLPGTFGATIAEVLAFLPLLAGLLMTLILAGLAVGWPLMVATVAAEDEDVFDALSRSYAYVYQRPARYAGYILLAWGIGALGLLVVGIASRGVLHMAEWGLSLGAPADYLAHIHQGNPETAGTAPAVIHSYWFRLIALLAYGWVFSYFWSSAVQIYLLLRQEVDGTPWHDIPLPGHEADAFAPEPTMVPTEPPIETPVAPFPTSSGPGS